MKHIPSILLFLFFIFLLWKFTNFKEKYFRWQYDKTSNQSIVTKQQDIDKILNQFETISFSDLPEEFIQQSNYNLPKYKKLVKNASFLKIKGNKIFQYLVGDFRIMQFLPRDDFYYDNLDGLGEGSDIYWMMDKKLLYKLLELQNLLVKKGYNETGFEIVNGYRHPAYNSKVGGASMSRHLQGQALDISIEDINDDGRVNQKDKQIVLDLLEKEIIKDKGGIGRYPGTMSVHFDVRGYKARWDKQ